MTVPVIDPQRDAAIGTRQHVEVAVMIDVRSDDDPELDVIAVGHELAEGFDLDARRETDLSARGQRPGSRRGGHQQANHHRKHGIAAV
jgi:hypothetical protein